MAMRSSFRVVGSSGLLAAALLLAGADARAQAAPGLPLDRFDPAPVGDRMFGVPSPFVAGHLTPHAGVLLEYAHNPLVLRPIGADQGGGGIVSSQLFLHVNATFALWNRLAINLDVPVAVFQAGGSPMGLGNQTFTSPDKAQMGELRAGLRVRLFGEYDDPFQIGLGGYVWFPTGPKDSFVGSGQVRGMPQLLLGGRGDRVVWSLAAGPQIRGTETFAGVTQGTQFNAGFGIAALLGEQRHFQIGPEVYTAFTLVKSDKSVNDALRRAANVEVLIDMRYRIIDDLEIGVGAGPGLTAGVGTPDFRGVFMLAYTPEWKRPPPDRDGDKIIDEKDACPDEPGVADEDPKKNGCPPPKDRDGDKIFDGDDACPDEPGVADPDPKTNGCPPPTDRDGDKIIDEKDACPDVKGVASDDPKKNGCPPDRDGDGIIDDEDACPDVKGVASDDPKKNGCPPDRDGDGIPDAEDACPDLKGVKTADPATNGCPPDTDGDGIRDDQDACPLEKGPPDPDPKKNGCPTVHVTEQEIIILEQVQFDTGKATIKRVSDGLLDKVAAVFKEHGEILKVQVQGHTDNKGLAAQNKILSQQRAEAVQKALVKRGIAAGRLVAKGFGQDVPIADNGTDAGRQQNRRVQFKIIEKQPKANK
jgi:outer membrane protein OmpA-like peptidoglycan-associated protein